LPEVVADPQLQPCAVCGNGHREDGEVCDDGNEVDGDGCSSLCREEACGVLSSDHAMLPACDGGDVCAAGEICLGGSCQTPAESPLRLRRLSLHRSRDNLRDLVQWKMEVPIALLPASPEHADLRAVLLSEATGPRLDVAVPAGLFQKGDRSRRFQALFEHPALGAGRATLVVDEKKRLLRLRLRLAAANLLSASEPAGTEALSVALMLSGQDPQDANAAAVSCVHSAGLSCRQGPRRMLCKTTQAGSSVELP
jgi:cysteine-rich repeat protein